MTLLPDRAARMLAVLVALATAAVLAVAPPASVPVSASGSGFSSITPTRVVDTRAGLGATRLGPATTRTVSLASVVPPGTRAVALNVTATKPTASTFFTVWPAGQSRPTSSNLNVASGGTRANAVLVGVSADRKISIYNQHGHVDAVVDVMGYFTDDFTGIRPARVMDTRANLGATRFGPTSTRSVRVAGVSGVPADAAAVAVNVTATNATTRTFMTVWPTGRARPTASNLNVAAGATVPNLAVVGVGHQGRISIYNEHGHVDGVVDIMGWFDATGGFRPVTPTRRLDTRTGACGLRLGPGESRRVDLGVTAASAVALNVTAVGATRRTYLTIWPSGVPRPVSSNLNVAPGGATPNMVVVGTGVGGQIDVYNHSGHVDLVIDVLGEFAGTAPAGLRVGCSGITQPSPSPGPSQAPSSLSPTTTTSPPRAVPTTTSPPATTAPATPTTTTTAPPATTAPNQPNPSGWHGDMLAAINAERAAHGRSPVALCGNLMNAAQDYAVVLRNWGKLSHTGPDGSTLGSRSNAAGYRGWSLLGENLAAGQSNVTTVMAAWMGSDGHRANILRADFTHVGLGKAGTAYPIYWVQKFGAGGSC